MARDCNKGNIHITQNNRRESKEDPSATIAVRRDTSQEIAAIPGRTRRGESIESQDLNKTQVNVITVMKLVILQGNAQVKFKVIQIKRDWYSL